MEKRVLIVEEKVSKSAEKLREGFSEVYARCFNDFKTMLFSESQNVQKRMILVLCNLK